MGLQEPPLLISTIPSLIKVFEEALLVVPDTFGQGHHARTGG